jgi:uncharacterized protein HemX
MASLATIVRGFVGAREELELMNIAVRPRTDSFRLRPLANEDVYLYVKKIDNATVVRAADPTARRASLGAVAAGFAVAMFVIAGLFPAAYNTMEGYHIQQLRTDQQRLKQEKATLNFQKAKLLSQDNLNRLAAKLKMSDPAPEQVQILDGNISREARNHLPLGNDPVSH